jgi:pimeloyl-ACP methyl ester carboxylesterase
VRKEPVVLLHGHPGTHATWHRGHHQAEQAPDELAAALLDFLGRPAPDQAA